MCDDPEGSSLPTSISITPTIYLYRVRSQTRHSSELGGERTVDPPPYAVHNKIQNSLVFHILRAPWGIGELENGEYNQALIKQ